MKYFKAIIMIVTLHVCTQAWATDDKFVETMQKNIKAIYEVNDIAGYQQSINTFERIAAAEKTKWEPFYYIGFGYMMMANLEEDGQKKDAYLDKGIEAVEKGKVIAPNESELIALEGFGYMLKLSIDPMSRGMSYAPRATQTFEKSIALNPENPRALAMMAQMQFGSAQFFGSSTAEACATNISALEKFKTYKADNVLAPVWGSRMAEGLSQQCK